MEQKYLAPITDDIGHAQQSAVHSPFFGMFSLDVMGSYSGINCVIRGHNWASSCMVIRSEDENQGKLNFLFDPRQCRVRVSTKKYSRNEYGAKRKGQELQGFQRSIK